MFVLDHRLISRIEGIAQSLRCFLWLAVARSQSMPAPGIFTREPIRANQSVLLGFLIENLWAAFDRTFQKLLSIGDGSIDVLDGRR